MSKKHFTTEQINFHASRLYRISKSVSGEDIQQFYRDTAMMIDQQVEEIGNANLRLAELKEQYARDVRNLTRTCDELIEEIVKLKLGGNNGISSTDDKCGGNLGEHSEGVRTSSSDNDPEESPLSSLLRNRKTSRLNRPILDGSDN